MGRGSRVLAALAVGLSLGTVAAHADGVSGVYSEAVLSDAPVVFYPLDSQGQVAVDDSGHGHTIPYQGSGGEQSQLTFLVPGPLDAAANGPSFGVRANGVPVATLPGAAFLPSGNAARTLEGWFKSSPATQAGARYPIVAWGATGQGHAYGLVVMQHAVVIDYFSGATTVQPAPYLFDGRWHQVASTYDGHTVLVYVDGVQIGPAGAPIGTLDTQSPSTLLIGNWVDNVFNSPLQGSVADVAVYPAALSGARIRAHFLAARGQVSGSVVSSFASSLPTFSDAFGNAGIVLASAAVAVGGTLFITFPAQLFNLTLQENYATITGWLAPLRRRAAAVLGIWRRSATRAPLPAEASTAQQLRAEWPSFVLVVGVGALLGGFLDPNFGVNVASLELYAGMVLSMLAGIAVGGSVSELYHRRRFGPVRRHLRALPLGLVLGLLCVVVSRVTSFQPGYLYGVVVGVAFDRTLSARESGHVAALSTLAVVCVSVLAWVVWVPLNAHAAAAGAFPLLIVFDDLLAALVVGGLVGTVIGLLPLRFLPGGTIREWDPRVWIALFGAAVFGLVEFVIRSPAAGGGHHSGLVVTLVLFVLFAGVSVGFREYFAARWRREHDARLHGGVAAWLHELVTPRPAEPAAGDVAVSGGAGASTVITDEAPEEPAPRPTVTPGA